MAHAGCGGDACTDVLAADDPGKWLNGYVDTTKARVLNESVDGAGARVFKSYDHRADCVPFVESCADEDAELIAFVPFTQPVRVKSLCVVAGGSEALAPLRARVFVDRDDVDFASAGELKPVQTFDLVPDFRGLVDYHVVASKFAGVSSVTIHLQGSVGGERVRVNCLGFKGEPTGFRRGVVETTYEARAQLKDHPKTKAEGFGGASTA